MTRFGCFLSSEEHGPTALVEQAQRAEQAGFSTVSISDHFHPWLDSQGQSPFVWGVIGGIAATTDLEVTTAVTCPMVRIHPAILAQATATASAMLDGRFRFGVGTGERLNEHVLGDHWPPAAIRREMLDEAVSLIRELWRGENTTLRGTHYAVENARIYTTPPATIPVLVSAFGPESTELACRIGDGVVTTAPDEDVVDAWRQTDRTGPAVATIKVCWAEDEETARKTAHRLWASSGIPGEASQELAVPRHFEQAADLVTPEQIAEKIPCGPDPATHLEVIGKYVDAGFDETHIGQVGSDQQGFLDFWASQLAPELSVS
jgi:G6PDH family F420-dependent oxidoreductase